MKRGGHIIGAAALALIGFQHVAPMAAAGGATDDEASMPAPADAGAMKNFIVGEQAIRAFCRTIMPERAADFDELEARDKALVASSNQDPDVKLLREVMAAPDFHDLVAKTLKGFADDKEAHETFKSVYCAIHLESLNQ